MTEAMIQPRDVPAAERRQGDGPRRSARAMPLVRLLLYYAIITAIGAAVMNLVPGGHHMIAAPIAPAATEATDLVMGKSGAASAPLPPDAWTGQGGRLALTFITVLGALAIALPVAWVHMLTRRLRYNPSLVHTMVILPIVVAGVVLVVKNSLALAFALAGIVAGVRFRQKLNEPKEAVYVLLSLGIGLAAGVQALDIALAVSLAFNGVVLVIWRYDLGSLESRGARPLLSIGNPALLPVGEERRELYQRAVHRAGDMEVDGILVICARDAESARHGVEVSLIGNAAEWRTTRVRTTGDVARFEVILRLAGKTDPVDILGDIEERWSAQIDAAEYIPFRRRLSEKPDEDEDDDDDD